MYDSENDVKALQSSVEEERAKNAKTVKPVYFYRLNDEIANDVKYFGQESSVNGHKIAACICPICEELWRVDLASVRSGLAKSCGCAKGKK